MIFPLASNASLAFPNKNSFPGKVYAFTPGASKILRKCTCARDVP